MQKLLVAGLAVATLSSFAPAAQAAPSPIGVLCGFSSVEDPQVEGGPHTAEVDAGPLLWTDDTDPAVTYSGSVTCTIQIGAGTHAGADACVVAGPETAVVGFAAGTCTFPADDDDVYLCTQVSVGGTTLYYDDDTRDWSADPASRCSFAVPILEPLTDEAIWLVSQILGNYCPVFAIVFPPEGDIPGVWDCPPYGV